MTPTAYFMLAAAALLGATLAGIAAWWWISRLRRENADLTTDLANAAIRHQAEQAEWQHALDEARLGWRDEYRRATNLTGQLAAEQHRLDAADRDKAALRGRIADLEDTVADYARAWSDVPHAWRTSVIDLERVAPDDVWAPPLEPSPVLMGLLADGVKGEAPGLPDEWEPESVTEWFAKIQVPEPERRAGRSKYKHRKAVGR